MSELFELRERQAVHVPRLDAAVEDRRALGPGVEAGRAAHVVGGPLDRRSRALDTPPEAVAACKTASGLPSSAQAPGEFGKVETTENNLFGGFSLVQ